MKLEKELNDIAYWFLGLSVYLGMLLVLAMLTAYLLPEISSESLLGIVALATFVMAVKGRYGALNLINVLITLAIFAIPVLNLFAIPYYIGKGFYIITSRQEPIYG